MLQFQLNPGVLPFFPSQFLPKDTQCDMLEPLDDRFNAVDESLADWNPLDYNALWTQGPQSPFSQVHDKDSDLQHGSHGGAQTWCRTSASSSQHGSQHEQQASAGLSEQVRLMR